MKKLAIPAIALLLSGCAASEQPAPIEEPVESVNVSACKSFAKNTAAFSDIFDEEKGNANDQWDALKTLLDQDALSAEGDVKERILLVVNGLPSVGDVFIYKEAREKVNGLVESVARACEAEGTEVIVNTYLN